MAGGNYPRSIIRRVLWLLLRLGRQLWRLWLLLLGDVGRSKGVVVVLRSLGCSLRGELLLRGWGNMESRVHAEGSLGCAGSRGRVGSLTTFLGCLLKGIEVGDIDSVGGGGFGSLDGALDVGGSITGSHRHVCRRSGALGTLKSRTVRIPLPLLPR